jgi:ABC-type glycerol-3-phosphate transport system substrate-binding protein
MAALPLFAGGARNQSSTTQQGGLTTLTIMTWPGSLNSGIYKDNTVSEALAQDLGIQLELILGTADVVNTRLAAQDLPDITVFNADTQLANAIDGRLLVNLDEHISKLPNVVANGHTMLQYMRDQKSNGTGGLYAVRYGINNTVAIRGMTGRGPIIRWDYYRELGYPKADELEDFLPILKTMLERHPVTEDGQKVYGITGGGYKRSPVAYIIRLYGYSAGPGPFSAIDLRTGQVVDYFDTKIAYRAAKFLFNANQMGLVDPDMPTMNEEPMMWAKMEAGRVLFSLFEDGFFTFNPQNLEAGKAMLPVYFTNTLHPGGVPSYIGDRTGVGISAKTRNLDKALAFLDYSFSWDGAWNLTNGPRGLTWDLDSSGEPYWTQDRIKANADNNFQYPNGIVTGYFGDIISGGVLGSSLKHPVYGRALGGGDWVDKDWYTKPTAIELEWQEFWGALDTLDYLNKNNKIIPDAFAPLPTPPEEIQILTNQINELVLWDKLVFARNEAEFESLYQDMVTQMKARGLEQVQEWYRNAYNQSKAASAKYVW